MVIIGSSIQHYNNVVPSGLGGNYICGLEIILAPLRAIIMSSLRDLVEIEFMDIYN